MRQSLNNGIISVCEKNKRQFLNLLMVPGSGFDKYRLAPRDDLEKRCCLFVLETFRPVVLASFLRRPPASWRSLRDEVRRTKLGLLNSLCLGRNTCSIPAADFAKAKFICHSSKDDGVAGKLLIVPMA